ncbi:MAG: type II toxin-antitoxin system HigB family toxin [Bacteroidales bacterium]|nr:type II toxin-antitoxin system HigB family toxin [Bacteroidales bacterium]MCF8457963.1 type II toxin-antitoxin system HigB family toxin [Bacteroidales bacterium]
MKIRNRALLEKFVKKHADSKKAMQKFIDIVEEAEWQTLNDIKSDFNSVDYVTNERYVFDIRGNKYRIIAVIIFVGGVFSIRFVGTHAEYSKIDAKLI